ARSPLSAPPTAQRPPAQLVADHRHTVRHALRPPFEPMFDLVAYGLARPFGFKDASVHKEIAPIADQFSLSFELSEKERTGNFRPMIESHDHIVRFFKNPEKSPKHARRHPAMPVTIGKPAESSRRLDHVHAVFVAELRRKSDVFSDREQGDL